MGLPSGEVPAGLALLLDEPASGLINSEIDEMDLIIRRLVDEYHIAAILIEHQLELLSAIADRAVVLDMGKVIATGTPHVEFQTPRVLAACFEQQAHGWHSENQRPAFSAMPTR